ncbi:MAG: hypothetical protein U5L96_08500 [Owenweeksia sp.]|nr:hypothetical protein [Owenweeksia sp.]
MKTNTPALNIQHEEDDVDELSASGEDSEEITGMQSGGLQAAVF